GGMVGLRTDRAGFWIKDEAGYPLEIAQGYNNWLAEYCGAAPERLKGVALVPYHDPREGIGEMGRAVGDLGCVGVLQRCAYKDLSPADPYFDPLYAEVERLGVPLMVHIGNDALQHFLIDRFRYPALWWHGVGNPMSMLLAVTDLVCGGVFEKFP